jgi:hypothetical protein
MRHIAKHVLAPFRQPQTIRRGLLDLNKLIDFAGSFKFRVGYRAWGLIWAKSSFPAIRNRTVRIVAKRL